MLEVKTKMTKKGYLEFQKFHLFRGRYSRYGMPLLALLCLFIAVVVIQASFWMSSEMMRFLWVMLAIALSLFFIAVFFAYIYPRIHLKKVKPLFEIEVKILFDSDYMIVEETSDTLKERSTIKYEELYKIFEKKKIFYIYIEPRKGFLIPKSDIIKGSSKELGKFLTAKSTTSKYIVCK